MEEALQGLHTIGSVVTITNRPIHAEEDVTVSTFMFTGCGCHKAKGAPCFRQLPLCYVEEFRAELTHAELDMVTMGQLVAQ